MARHDNESDTACLAIGELAHLYLHLSSFFFGIPEHRVRRPNHSGDGDHRSLSRIELCNLHLNSLPLLDLRESLSPVQDVFGPRAMRTYSLISRLRLAMNTRRPKTGFPQPCGRSVRAFFANTLPACANLQPRAPCPIQFEASPMPSDNRLRLDNDKRTLPPRPEPPQHHPKDSVPSSEPRPGGSCFEDIQLLSQSQNFQQ